MGKLPVVVYPSVKIKEKIPGKSPLSTAIIVKPAGRPLWRPVPIIVNVWLFASDVNVAELTEFDSKWSPESWS